MKLQNLSYDIKFLQGSWKTDVALEPKSTSRHARDVTPSAVKNNKDTEVNLHFIEKLIKNRITFTLFCFSLKQDTLPKVKCGVLLSLGRVRI